MEYRQRGPSDRIAQRSWLLPACVASLPISALAASVSMKPGATLRTRTPCGPTSFDRPLL